MRIVDMKSGRNILSVGDISQGDPDEIYDIQSISWRCEYSIDESIATLTMNSAAGMLTVFFIFILFGLIGAYLLASLLYSPVRKLSQRIQKIPVVAEKQPLGEYEQISTSIEIMMHSLAESRHAALCRAVLTGDLEGVEDIEEGFFNDHTWYQVLYVVTLDETGIKNSHIRIIQNFILSNQNITCELMEVDRSELAIIAASQTEDDCMRLCDDLVKELRDADDLGVFSGGQVYGWHEISSSYLQVRRRLRYLQGIENIRYYFPLDWENQLITALRSGNTDHVTGLLNELKRQNSQRLETRKMDENDLWQFGMHVQSDIRRVAMENGLDDFQNVDGSGTPEELWQAVERNCRLLCLSMSERNVPKDNTAQRVVDFIEQHGFESDFSMSTVKEAFGLSDKTIGKYVYSVTGEKYLNYLTKIRMEEAKRLLTQEKMKSGKVAELIGYNSDFSFQRAFLRYTGSKVQDWIAEENDKHSD